MWNWDQGRMQYFQYDSLRSVANFIVDHDFKNSDPTIIRKLTGLEFAAPTTHSPWRNYSRIYKLCLLVSEENGVAIPTDIARLLSQTGAVTCDEYLHFLVEATTDPSPALSNWSRIERDNTNLLRSPLCFALKYILAKVAGRNESITPINEIIAAYAHSNFSGNESDEEYLGLISKKEMFPQTLNAAQVRQARESIKFISQISYLHNTSADLIVSLSNSDAHDIFQALSPVGGIKMNNGNHEILRLATLFRDGTHHDFFDYRSTILSDEIESGFNEGSKLKKTHIVIERNSKLRKIYFEKFPSPVCDSCDLDTSKKYPWVDRALDLHHILPLSSGTRVDSRTGTILSDMVPVCPTCHRAIHRYYDNYLKSENKKDFSAEVEAREVYQQSKNSIFRGNSYV